MKKIFIVLLLLLIVGIWLWLRHDRPAGQMLTESPVEETDQPPPQAQSRTSPASVSTPASVPNSPAQDGAAMVEDRINQIRTEIERGNEEWRTPIEFYGKVVDENDQPLEGARIMFGTTDLSPAGTSDYASVSDAQGLFSITGIQGKLLTVKVAKAGYYTSKRNNDSFYYAGQNENFVPDAANPVVFQLKIKGVAESLVHVQAPMGGAKGFRIARDGTALEISLTSGKTVSLGQGDLRVQCWTDDQNKPRGAKYEWKCQISVPNGGIIQYEGEFPFQAPLAGYQPSDEIGLPANMEEGWSRSVKRSYFLKLANGNYARMSFEMVAGGDHFFQLESFLNPSGSRNLELDPDKIIIAQ